MQMIISFSFFTQAVNAHTLMSAFCQFNGTPCVVVVVSFTRILCQIRNLHTPLVLRTSAHKSIYCYGWECFLNEMKKQKRIKKNHKILHHSVIGFTVCHCCHRTIPYD